MKATVNASTRIVALTHEFYPRRGGIATYVEEVARACALRGDDIEVWAPRAPELAHARLGFEVRSLPLPGTQDWSCRIRLSRFLARERERWRDAVIYLPEPGPLRAWLYLQMMEGFRARRLVITLHGSEIIRFTAAFHRRRLFHRLLRRADRISAVSCYTRDLLLSRFPDLSGRVTVAYGAPRALPAPATESGARPDGSGRVRLLVVGRIHPRKGHLALVEALGRMSEAHRSRAVLRMVGPVSRPAYLDEVLRRATASGVAIEQPGVLDDEALAAEYHAADVFVMTSTPTGHSVEGLGLVYLDASSVGLPVIAHRTGGVAEAVRDGETGLLVAPGDTRALTRALESLVGDDALRKRLARAGREWAAGFSWSRCAATLFEGLD